MVIVDMDMPKNCNECLILHRGEYGAFEKSWCGLNSESRISEKKRPADCPIKSLDSGLIGKLYKRVLDVDTGKATDFEESTDNFYVMGMLDAVKIIKEYCGTETENAD